MKANLFSGKKKEETINMNTTFLVQSELTTVSTAELINKLTGSDATIVPNIIDESISIMSGKLSKYYDIDAIFSATGDTRHKTILKWLKDITIYEIYERHTREQNSVAKRRRDEAMAELEKLNTGENYDRTLPPRDSSAEKTATQSDDIRFGGDFRYNSNY